MSEIQPPPPEDGETIQLIQQRNPEGLQRLLDRHAARVRWQLRSEFRTLPDTELDAAINLAAHRVWQNADTFNPSRGTLRAWFYVITRNCAIESLRRDARHREHVQIADWDYPTSPTSPEPNTEEVSRPSPAFLGALRRCVEALPRLQQKIIKADLASVDVAEASQLAREFGSTKNSIYVSRSMARRSLKVCLEQRGHRFSPEPDAGESSERT